MQFSIQSVAALATFVAAVSALPNGVSSEERSEVAAAELGKRVDHYGDGTYYTQGGVAGSCGQVHGDYDYIGALSPYWMNQGTFCGRKLTVQNNPNNGKSVTILVADTCEGCKQDDVDLSVGAFKGLQGGSLSAGRIPIKWHFNAQ